MATSIEAAQEIISNIAGLPTLPSVLGELLKMVADPQTSARDITGIISRDPALTSKVLKLVNSAFYALPQRVHSLQTAVSILGFNSVRNVAVAASFLKIFPNREGFDAAGFWLHSLGAGVTCDVLVKDASGQDADAFVYGLLHDVGKIVMVQYLSGEAERVLNRVKQRKCLFHEAEQELLGYTHAELGSVLAREWRFPDQLHRAIRYHHEPGRAGSSIREAALAHMGDLCARAMQIGWAGDDRVPAVSPAAWEALALTESAMPQLMENVHNGMLSAEAFIELTRG